MKYVITGATGCIGNSLIRLLEDKKKYALILLHKESKRNNSIVCSEYIKTDFCNIDEYNTYNNSESYDVFIHMAWVGGCERNNVDVHYKNVQYAIDALKLAKRLGCKRFIFTGSQAECGLLNKKIDCNTLCNPVNSFGASKLYAGYLTRFLGNQIGIDHVWCRILSVYGPYDRKNAMISAVLREMLLGNDVKLTKCEQQWDFMYSEDAAEAIYLCAENGVNNKIYPIGSGEVRTLKEYIEIMRNLTSSKSNILYGDILYSENQTMFLGADISELSFDTGFKIRYSFEDGIHNTIAWINKNF